jgi:3-methylfumaryl-CoA hydratase
LVATLLLNLLRREIPIAEVKEINLRATAPIFSNQPFSVNGVISEEEKKSELWAATKDGNLAMIANVLLA